MAESGTPTPLSLAFGATVRAMRARRELSLEQVSARLQTLGESMAPTVLSRIERGRRELRVTEALALARVLNVTPAELLDAADPASAVAQADRLVSDAYEHARESIDALTAALSRRWQTDPETFTAPAAEPMRITVQAESREPIRAALAELGVAASVDLRGTGA